MTAMRTVHNWFSGTVVAVTVTVIIGVWVGSPHSAQGLHWAALMVLLLVLLVALLLWGRTIDYQLAPGQAPRPPKEEETRRAESCEGGSDDQSALHALFAQELLREVERCHAAEMVMNQRRLDAATEGRQTQPVRAVRYTEDAVGAKVVLTGGRELRLWAGAVFRLYWDTGHQAEGAQIEEPCGVATVDFVQEKLCHARLVTDGNRQVPWLEAREALVASGSQSVPVRRVRGQLVWPFEGRTWPAIDQTETTAIQGDGNV